MIKMIGRKIMKRKMAVYAAIAVQMPSVVPHSPHWPASSPADARDIGGYHTELPGSMDEATIAWVRKQMEALVLKERDQLLGQLALD